MQPTITLSVIVLLAVPSNASIPWMQPLWMKLPSMTPARPPDLDHVRVSRVVGGRLHVRELVAHDRRRGRRIDRVRAHVAKQIALDDHVGGSNPARVQHANGARRRVRIFEVVKHVALDDDAGAIGPDVQHEERAVAGRGRVLDSDVLGPGIEGAGAEIDPRAAGVSRLWPPSIVNPDAVAPNSNDIWGDTPWSGAIVIALSVPVHVP